MDGPTYRISGVTAAFMLTTAGILDILQLLLALTVIGAPLAELMTFIAAPLFGIWFLIMGVGYFSGKKATAKVVSALVSTAVELIPIVDAIPGITAGVWGVIWASWKEDKEKYEEQRVKAIQQAQADMSRENQIARMQARAESEEVSEEADFAEAA